MRLATGFLSVFFLVALLASPTPSFSQKNRPAHYEVNDAIHFEASVPEAETTITQTLAVLFDLTIPAAATDEHFKCDRSFVSNTLCSVPRLHLKLRVFRN